MLDTIDKVKKSADDLEKSLAVYFLAKAPALPTSVKELIVNWLYTLIIIGIIFSGLGLLMMVGGLLGMGVSMPMFGVGMMPFSLVFIMFLIYGVELVWVLYLEVKALPLIKKRDLVGWKLLYYSLLVSLVAGLLTFRLIGVVVSGLIGFYFLFQIKEYYK